MYVFMYVCIYIYVCVCVCDCVCVCIHVCNILMYMYSPNILISVNCTFSEVAWALESNSKLSLVDKPDIHGKTPVDYADKGTTPR